MNGRTILKKKCVPTALHICSAFKRVEFHGTGSEPKICEFSSICWINAGFYSYKHVVLCMCAGAGQCPHPCRCAPVHVPGARSRSLHDRRL